MTRRDEGRETGLRQLVSVSHHFSCSMGLAARGRRTRHALSRPLSLTSSDLHAVALTSGLTTGADPGEGSSKPFCASEVLAAPAGAVSVVSASFAVGAAAPPSAVSALGVDSLPLGVAAVWVDSDLTALLGLRKRPPSICGRGELFLLSPSTASPSVFSFLAPKLLKIEVRRLSLTVGLTSDDAAAGLATIGLSGAGLVSVAADGATVSSVLTSFFCYHAEVSQHSRSPLSLSFCFERLPRLWGLVA
jgi:hypothetical protein